MCSHEIPCGPASAVILATVEKDKIVNYFMEHIYFNKQSQENTTEMKILST